MFDIKSIASRYPKSTTALICFVALIILTLVIQLLSIDRIIESFELKTLDWRFQQTQMPSKVDSRITLIVLDDLSIQKGESNPELGLKDRLLPDETTAKVINFLSEGGAKVIAFNSKFEGSKLDPETSKPFINAIKEAGNVYFPIVFSYTLNNFLQTLAENPEVKIIKDDSAKNKIIKHFKQELLNTNSEKLRDQLKQFKLDILNEDLFVTFPYRDSVEYLTFGPIYYEILHNCSGVGAINVVSDDDGVLRKAIPVFNYNKNLYPSFALSIAKGFLPESESELTYSTDGEILFGNKVLPLDKQGRFMIKWMAPTGTYKHYRIVDILTSYNQLLNDELPLVSPAEFKDKIVIIGETIAGPNKLTTPVSKAISGTEVQANIIDNMINRKHFITQLPFLGNFIIALLFSFIVSTTVMKLKSGFSVAFTYAGLVFGYMIFALAMFGFFDLWIAIVYPLAFMTLVFIVTFLVKYTILAKAYEDTFQLAIKDGLTTLFNHKYFQETLARDLSRSVRHNEEMSLLMIDIDHFKKFNDTYGHRAGDAILRQVAMTLKKTVRTSDLVARYGGEEMVIILYNSNYDNSKLVANKLLNIINDTVFVFKDTAYKNITISIGVSNHPTHANVASQLIDVADQSLYYAKRNGRNQVGLYEYLEKDIKESL